MNVNLKMIYIDFEKHSDSGKLVSKFHRLQDLAYFIKKSLKLKKLKIKFCNKITKNLIIVAKRI